MNDRLDVNYAEKLDINQLATRNAMEAMSVKTKLHLHAPPVVETAIQIQFSDLPRWNSVHHGLYFPKIRARYPHFELIPEIPPVVETFPPSPKRLQLQLTARQDPGCAQFESLNHDRLIRVQRNRFAFHWKSIVSSESTNYPRYEANIRSFVDEFAVFQEFCFEESLGSISPLLCEVMYLNHVKPNPDESLEQMVDSIFGSNLGAFELFTLNRTFTKDANRGRLYAELNSAFDDTPYVTFQLTSRINHDDGEFLDSLNLAHDWLIEVFTNLTSQKARKERWHESG